jgi:chloramphenicol 3-O-phosphotransferase
MRAAGASPSTKEAAARCRKATEQKRPMVGAGFGRSFSRVPFEISHRRVVVINGPAGVGKTTVGRLVAGSARNGVCIHGDDLKQFVVTRDLDSVSTGLSYIGAAALADVFLDGGYDLVVIDFVFPRSEHVELFRSALKSGVSVLVFTLWAPLETVVTREAQRAGRERLGPQVAETWNDMHPHRAELGTPVDTTPAPQAVADEIRRRLALDRGC